ncbi:DUF2142 domain-containing protein [Georgenia sp. M64]|uniref:DUF2142 domain-containing protein n=1 Tax=Georgenia sp. M64 TaxID=3120520 RepID=UPI0030E53752
MSQTSYRRTVAALTVLLGAVMALWAVLTPGFRAPDEPQHYNSVMRVATGGGWPAPGTAMISDATLIATREAGFSRQDQGIGMFTASLLPRGTLQGWGADFVELQPSDPAQRSVLDHTANLQDEIAPSHDQMTQHPPLYYGLMGGLVALLGGDGWRWDVQLLFMRLVDAFIAMWSVPLVAATARRVVGSATAGVVAGAGVVGIGQFAHINAAVTNDSLTTVLGLGVTYLAARALTGRHTTGLVVVTGVTLGLGLLTKGFLLAAIPVVALAFVLGRAGNPRTGRRWLSAFAALAVAFVVGGWWWARNLLVHGTLQPSGMPTPRMDWGDQTPTAVEFVPEAFERLNRSIWGNFGWLEVPLPFWLEMTLGILLVVLVVAAVVVPSPERRPMAVLLVLPVGTLAVVMAGSVAHYSSTGLFGGLQGRYLFSGLAAMLTAVAWSLTRGTRRIAPRFVRWLPLASVVTALALAAFSVVWAFQAFYQPYDGSVSDAVVRWGSWSLLTTPWLAVTVVAPAVLGVAALVLARPGARADEPRPAGELALHQRG